MCPISTIYAVKAVLTSSWMIFFFSFMEQKRPCSTYLELPWVSANKIWYLVAILEDHESRHLSVKERSVVRRIVKFHKKEGETYSSHPNFLCDIALLINIDLVELHTLVFSKTGEFLKNRWDSFAWAAPGRPEINQDWFARVDLHPERVSFMYTPRWRKRFEQQPWIRRKSWWL